MKQRARVSCTVTRYRILHPVATVVMLLASSACHSQPREQSPQASNLTAGMAKRSIAKGVTTQAEILEVFGPPDLVTHRDDIQIWTYDKIRHEVESSDGYLNVLIAGTSSGRTTRSSTSTMLMLYFDAQDVVRDYRLSVVRF